MGMPISSDIATGRLRRLNDKSLIVNLSVEVWNYYPVSFKEITSAVTAFKREEKKAYSDEGTVAENATIKISRIQYVQKWNILK